MSGLRRALLTAALAALAVVAACTLNPQPLPPSDDGTIGSGDARGPDSDFGAGPPPNDDEQDSGGSPPAPGDADAGDSDAGDVDAGDRDAGDRDAGVPDDAGAPDAADDDGG